MATHSTAFIGAQQIYNVILVSGVQQSGSVIHIHIHISTLFQILFPYGSLQSTEQSSLCYTSSSYQLSVIYICVCICKSQSPNLFPLSPVVPIYYFHCQCICCYLTSCIREECDKLMYYFPFLICEQPNIRQMKSLSISRLGLGLAAQSN